MSTLDATVLARVLAEHNDVMVNPVTKDWFCICGVPLVNESEAVHEAHVAEVLASLVAASETQARAEARAEAWEMAASFGTMPGLTWPETLRYHVKHHRAAALSSTDQQGGK